MMWKTESVIFLSLFGVNVCGGKQPVLSLAIAVSVVFTLVIKSSYKLIYSWNWKPYQARPDALSE